MRISKAIPTLLSIYNSMDNAKQKELRDSYYDFTGKSQASFYRKINDPSQFDKIERKFFCLILKKKEEVLFPELIRQNCFDQESPKNVIKKMLKV